MDPSRVQVLGGPYRGKTEGLIMLPGVLERRAVWWVCGPTKPEHDTEARGTDHG